jgi:hypothetical protein
MKARHAIRVAQRLRTLAITSAAVFPNACASTKARGSPKGKSKPPSQGPGVRNQVSNAASVASSATSSRTSSDRSSRPVATVIGFFSRDGLQLKSIPASSMASFIRARARRRRRRCTRRRPGRVLDFDADQLRADSEHLTHFAAEREHLARDRRRDLDRGLVGHHVGKALVLDDGVADRDVPDDELDLGDAFAEVGDADHVDGHASA